MVFPAIVPLRTLRNSSSPPTTPMTRDELPFGRLCFGHSGTWQSYKGRQPRPDIGSLFVFGPRTDRRQLKWRVQYIELRGLAVARIAIVLVHSTGSPVRCSFSGNLLRALCLLVATSNRKHHIGGLQNLPLLSKPPGQLHPEVSSVLLNRVLHILRAARVEVFFVEDVVEAGGKIQVLAKRVPQQGHIENRETTAGLSRQGQAPPGVLRIQGGEKLLLDQGDYQVEFGHVADGVRKFLVSPIILVRVHVAKARCALQTIRDATGKLDFHAGGLRFSGVSVDELAIAGIRLQRDQVVDPVPEDASRQLEALTKSFFHDSLDGMDCFWLKPELGVQERRDIGKNFVNFRSSESATVQQLKCGRLEGMVDQAQTRVRSTAKIGVMIVAQAATQGDFVGDDKFILHV